MARHVDPLADRLEQTSAWHVIVLSAGTVGAALVAVVLLVTIGDVTAGVSPLPARLHRAVVGLPPVIGLYAVGHRYLLRAPAGWFLAGRPDRTVLTWLAFGLALPAAALGGQLWLFDATWTGRLPPADTAGIYVLSSLAAGVLAGTLEELPFRGVLLRLLEARWGPRTALGGTALVFAALHQGHARSRVELALVVVSMVAAGLLLGVIAIRTRSVWNAVAVHAGWNAVFGGQVVTAAPAGVALEPGILRFRLPGPPSLLVGGGATLGAAPLTTALLLAAAVLLARRAPPPGQPVATGQEDR